MSTNNTTPETTNVGAVESAPAGAGTAGEQVAAKVTNLSAARREQSALRKAAKDNHPAGTEKPAAATTSAPATTAAKKTPAKKVVAPAKAAPVINGEKLRCTKVDDSDAATALTAEGSYSLLPADGAWKVEHRVGKKTTVLVAGVGRSAAYKAAIHHHRTGEVPAVKARKASA